MSNYSIRVYRWNRRGEKRCACALGPLRVLAPATADGANIFSVLPFTNCASGDFSKSKAAALEANPNLGGEKKGGLGELCTLIVGSGTTDSSLSFSSATAR